MDDEDEVQERRDFDAVVADIQPDGSVTYTPVHSSDPRMAGANLRPMTDEMRAQFGLRQEHQAAVERVDAQGVPGMVGSFLSHAGQPLGFNAAANYLNPENTATARAAVQEEANPVASTLGYMGGEMARDAVLLMAMEATGGLAGVPLLAEGGVAAALTARGFSPLAGAATSRAIAGAGWGALDGALDAVVQSNLHGLPIEGEQIVAGGLFGGLIGGAVGGATGVPSLVRAARSRRVAAGLGGGTLVEAGLTAEQRAAAGPLSFQRRAPQESPTPHGVIGIEGASGVTGRDLGVLSHYGPDAWDPTVARMHATNAADAATQAMNAVEETAARGANRWARVQAALNGVAEQVTTPAQMGQHMEVQEVLRQGIRAADGESAGLLRRALSLLGEAPPTAHVAVDRYDRVLGYLSEQGVLDRAGNTTAGPPLQALYRALAGSVDETGAESLGLLGSFGGRSEALARVHRDLLDARARAAPVRNFGSHEIVGGRGRWRVDANRLADAQAGHLGEVIPRDKSEAMGRMIAESDRRLGNIADLFGADVSQARAQLAHAANVIEVADEWSQVRELAIRAQMKEKQTAGFYAALGLGGAGLGAAAGAALSPEGGEGAGAVVGGGSLALLLASATHPVAALQLIQRMGSGVRNAEVRVARGGGRLRRSLSSPTTNVLGRNVTRAAIHARSQEQREEEYKAMRDHIRSLAGNPDRLQDTVADGAGVISSTINPVIGDAMAQTTVRGVNYLAQHLPPSDAPSLMGPLIGDDAPSLVEMESFSRRFEALQDPLGLLDWAAEGSLEVEHVESVAAVYPQLMALIRQEAAEALAQVRTLPSYQQRADLGTLLGVPPDQSFSGQMLQRLQQTYAQTTPQDRAQTTRMRSNVSVTMADHTQTSTQSVEATLR